MKDTEISRNIRNSELARIMECAYGQDAMECKDNEAGLSCFDCCIDWLKYEEGGEE